MNLTKLGHGFFAQMQLSAPMVTLLALGIGAALLIVIPARAVHLIDDTDIIEYSVWGDNKVDLGKSDVSGGLVGSLGSVTGKSDNDIVDGVRAS